MEETASKQCTIRKRRSEPSFGIDVVKNKKLLKYKDMQIFPETSFSSEQNLSLCTDNDNNIHFCLLCSEKYETKSLLNIHLWDHTSPSEILTVQCFTCLRCNKNYSVLTCFLQHMKNQHNNIHFCKYCSVSFDSFAAMKHHTKEVHTKHMILRGKETARFICAFCPASYYSAKLLIPHLKRYHPKQTALDEYYPKCTQKIIELTEGHEQKIKKRYKRTPLKCLDVTGMQVSPSKIDVTPSKMVPKYNCSHCGIKYISSINLQKHQRRCHKIDKVFKPTFGCAKCSAKFFNKNFLRKHLINHHGINVTPKI